MAGITRVGKGSPLSATDHDHNIRMSVGWTTVADLLQSTETGFAEGSILHASGHRYEVMSSASHLETAGGVHLKVLPGPRGYDVKAFGAVADANTTSAGSGTDDTDAVQAAILASFNSGFLVDGFQSNTIPIYIPGGPNGYRIAQPAKLFSTITKGSFRVEGDGAAAYRRSGASMLIFDPPTSGTDQVMISNVDVFGDTHFRNIGFKSVNGGKFGVFSGGAGVGTVQTFSWHRCTWYGFTDIFDIGGEHNTSEWTFMDCKVGGFSGTAFRFDNEQAVNWRFYSTDAEVFSGTLFEFLRSPTIYWSQGSIIPTSSTARFIKVPGTAIPASFGANNRPSAILHGARIEMRSSALLFEKVHATCNLVVHFSDCLMGGHNVPADAGATKIIYWRGKGRLVFRDCANMQRHYFDHSLDGSTTTQDLTVIMDNCLDLSSDWRSLSSFAITTSTGNVGRKPLFLITDCGQAHDGTYRVGSNTEMDGTPVRHAISFSPEAQRIKIANTGATNAITLPPVRLLELEVFPVTYATGNTSTIELLAHDGTTVLASLTWTANDFDARLQSYLNYKLTEAANTVTFRFTTSNAGLHQWAGVMYLTY